MFPLPLEIYPSMNLKSPSVIYMLVKIVRRLTLEEIEKRIKDLEKEYKMTFDEFEDLLLTKKIDDSLIDVYLLWAQLVHAYHGYIESGELECVIEETIDLNSEDLKVFTPKRLELLYKLSDLKVGSINELSQRIHRDVKNVYQDLQILKRLNLVIFRKRGRRNIVPESLVEEITFLTG